MSFMAPFWVYTELGSWILLASMYLVATPDPVMLFIVVNDSGSSFTPTCSALWVASH
jgi:lipid-A-disaccharide synthase-like uncharacterized protein